MNKTATFARKVVKEELRPGKPQAEYILPVHIISRDTEL